MARSLTTTLSALRPHLKEEEVDKKLFHILPPSSDRLTESEETRQQMDFEQDVNELVRQGVKIPHESREASKY